MKNKLLLCGFAALFLISCNGVGSTSSNTISGSNNSITTIKTINTNKVTTQYNQMMDSVVGVGIPTVYPGGVWWGVDCTGTVIDKEWVLTAAHCVADKKIGEFLPDLKSEPVYIVPWQNGGVPNSINPINSTETIKYKVKAIYIPANYNYYIDLTNGKSIERPYFRYMHEDLALLKLESTLPEQYKPLAISQNSFSAEYFAFPLRFVGYGKSAHYETIKELHDKEIFYTGNKFTDDYDGTTLDLNQIYAVGTKPVYSESYPEGYACSYAYIGSGDGAPIFHTAPQGTPMIIGIFSADMYAGAPGLFCDEIPNVMSANVSIPRYNNLIASIMNDSVAPSSVRCISLTGACNPSFAYIPNLQSDTVSLYRINKRSGSLQTNGGAAITTGLQFPVANIVDSSANYLFVLNLGHGSTFGYISSYKLNQYTGLATFTHKINTGQAPVDFTFDKSGKYIFVVNNKGNSVYVYNMNVFDGSLSFIVGTFTGEEPNSIAIAGDFVYVTNYKSDSISMFKFDSASGYLTPIFSDPNYYSVPTSKEPEQIKIDSSGRYAIVVSRSGGSGILTTYSISSDGYLHKIFDTTNLNSPILVNPTRILIVHDYVFVSSMENNTLSVYRLNQNGSLTYIRRYDNLAGAVGEMAADKSGNNIYLALIGVNKIAHFINRDGSLTLVSDNTRTGYYPAGIAIINR